MLVNRFKHILYLLLGLGITTMRLQAKPSPEKKAIAAFKANMEAGAERVLEQARALIDQAIAEQPAKSTAHIWYYRGIIYEKLLRKKVILAQAPQLLETALASYQQVLALTSATSQYHSFALTNINGLWIYYLDRGRRYYRQAAFESAIEQFEICKHIKPKESDAYLYAGIAAHQAGNDMLALHNYEQYLALGGTSPAVYRGIANIMHRQEPEKALTSLTQAMQHYPFNNDLLEEQLQICTTLDKVVAMERHLQEQLATAPCNAALHYQLGYLYAYQDKVQAALNHYQSAAEHAPYTLAPVRQLGVLHYNQAAHASKRLAELTDETLYYLQALPFLKRPYQHQLYDSFLVKCLDTHALEPVQAFAIVADQKVARKHQLKRAFIGVAGLCRHPLPCFALLQLAKPYHSFSLQCLHPPSLAPVSQRSLIYAQKIVRALHRKERVALVSAMHDHLHQALCFLTQAHQINKSDPFTLKCLHSVYLQLDKLPAANRIARMMRKINTLPFKLE